MFWLATGAALAMPLLFVGFLYIWPSSWTRDQSKREDPREIRKRFASVLLTCLSSIALAGAVLGTSWPHVLRSLGLWWRWPDAPIAFCKGIALIATLFLGPLVQETLSSVNPLSVQVGDALNALVRFDVLQWRALIVAPVSEELVFRGCMCAVLLAGGYSATATILCAPLFFGLAHLHHLAVRPAREVLFQFGYTTVFGWITAFIHVRGGLLLAPIGAHVFCNFMGFPPIADVQRSKHKLLFSAAYIVGLVSFFIFVYNY
jgi:intramembrane prenyl-peptidase